MKENNYIREDSTKQVKFLADFDINEYLGIIIGEKFQDYRKRWDAATNFEHCGEYPIHLDIELNNYCNLRCAICEYDLAEEFKKDQTPKMQIDIELVKKIIIDGIPLGLSSIGTSVNNEPFMKKDIVDFCRWASQNGVLDIIVTTNATLMTKEISDSIIDSGITRLRFSLDAYSKDLYEQIRIGAKYEKTIENIEYFLSLKKKLNKKLPVTSVNFVLMEKNRAELEQFKNYWRDKVDFVAVQNLVPVDHTEMRVSDLRPVVENFRCPQPFQRLLIRADGEVMPCTYCNKGHYVLGNVYEKSVREMWKSDFMQQLRKAQLNGNYRNYKTCVDCSSSFCS